MSASASGTGGLEKSGGSGGTGGTSEGGNGGAAAPSGADLIVGDTTSIQTSKYRTQTLYKIPGRSDFESNHAFRYVAIVTGSEPGANGHPGLPEDSPQRASLLANLPTIAARVSLDLGGSGLLGGDGSLSDFEAYTAKALGSALYRPFYAQEAELEDGYGINWEKNLEALVARAGGIPEDSVRVMMARVEDGQAIASNQNGATEWFEDFGSSYQPLRLRTDKTFERTPARLEAILASYAP